MSSYLTTEYLKDVESCQFTIMLTSAEFGMVFQAKIMVSFGEMTLIDHIEQEPCLSQQQNSLTFILFARQAEAD